MNSTLQEILVESINGKEYFYKEGDFIEFIFWEYSASKFYSNLFPNPFKEEWEHEEDEKNGELTFRDMETIMVPILLDDNGDELEPEQIAELYNIKLTHISGHGRFINNDEIENYHWNMGERDEKPFSDYN